MSIISFIIMPDYLFLETISESNSSHSAVQLKSKPPTWCQFTTTQSKQNYLLLMIKFKMFSTCCALLGYVEGVWGKNLK